jgi:hypothetical protein
MARNIITGFGEWLMEIFKLLPTPVKPFFALIFAFLFALLVFSAASKFVLDALVGPVFWVIAGLLTFFSAAGVVFCFCFPGAVSLSSKEKMVFFLLQQRLAANSTMQLRNFPRSTYWQTEALCDLFKRLSE